MELKPIENFSDFLNAHSWQRQWRNRVRDAAVFLLSSFNHIPRQNHWIRFPYYHHVFNDERTDFASHLRYLQNFGDFISLDDALEILESDNLIQGRYFCITFDDGFKNCVTNAVPILIDQNVPATFFLPTRYIGSSAKEASDFWYPLQITLEFLTWDDCRQMMQSNMTFGSHGVNHLRLIDLSDIEVERELRDSKEQIERELQIQCKHFCAPVGRPDIDYNINRDPTIARQLGYRSFLTTQRGSVWHKPDPMMIERDHIMVNWRKFQLRYFFSR